MSRQGKQILAEALNLPPIERAEIVEELLGKIAGKIGDVANLDNLLND